MGMELWWLILGAWARVIFAITPDIPDRPPEGAMDDLIRLRAPWEGCGNGPASGSKAETAQIRGARLKRPSFGEQG